MLKIKQILKAIIKNKTLASLNVLSLVIAFTGIITLTLYVSFERSFDSFHRNKDCVYRLDSPKFGCHLPLPVSKAIENKFPEIKAVCPLWFYQPAISTQELTSQNIEFSTKAIIVDSTFFSLLSFPVVLGNPNGILSKPKTAVLSQSLAHKLFAKANPIGKDILVSGKSYSVVGVINDFPENSSIQADILTSSVTQLAYYPDMENDWSDWKFHIWIKTSQDADLQLLLNKIAKIESLKGFAENMARDFPDQDMFKFIALSELHFMKGDENYSHIDKQILNVLTLLIVILVAMGSFNFINFSTSQAPLKAKTLSLFRILGGKRFSSICNVIFESIILSLLALVIALLIYFTTYTSIENLFDIQGLAISGRYHYIVWFMAATIVFAIIASLYPSLYVTSPALSQSVKGNAYFKNKGKNLRNGIILLQFAFTIILVASSFTIEKQLRFWSNFDIGINKEQVVYFPLNKKIKDKHETLTNEITKLNNVSEYTYTQFIPGHVAMGWGRMIDNKLISLKSWPVDDQFIDFFGIKILEGRKFKQNSEADINTLIINKKAVDKLEWEKPLGKTFFTINEDGLVIGVAENFNFSSLKEEILPMVLWRTDTRKNNLLLRINTDNYQSTFAKIKQIISNIDPSYNVEINFLDDELNHLYKREQNTARFIEFVALWCILLALTGLTGLAMFMARDKIKEIGIRRVNGASLGDIILFFNKMFIKWVAIAFVIACPIAYYAMSKWLENFAYKTELSWWIFALAGISALSIALITVSWQSWKAATRNPVEALRYE